MISNTLKNSLNSFSIRNNIIMPSKKTFEKMNMTRQEYIFNKWSYHRNLKKVNSGDSKATASSNGGTVKTMNEQQRRLFWRLV